MWPDRVSNSGPLTLYSDTLPTALRGPRKLMFLRWHSATSYSLLYEVGHILEKISQRVTSENGTAKIAQLVFCKISCSLELIKLSDNLPFPPTTNIQTHSGPFRQ